MRLPTTPLSVVDRDFAQRFTHFAW